MYHFQPKKKKQVCNQEFGIELNPALRQSKFALEVLLAPVLPVSVLPPRTSWQAIFPFKSYDERSGYAKMYFNFNFLSGGFIYVNDCRFRSGGKISRKIL